MIAVLFEYCAVRFDFCYCCGGMCLGEQQINSDSDISLVNYDYKSSKTNLKGRLSDIFRRSASLSRNDSEDGADKAGANSRSTTPNHSSRHKSPATIRPVHVSVQLSLAVRTNNKKNNFIYVSIQVKTANNTIKRTTTIRKQQRALIEEKEHTHQKRNEPRKKRIKRVKNRH